jgi:hypothetical protein
MAAEEEKPDPVKELLKLRTYNDWCRDFMDEQIELGAEPLEGAHEFNLNNSVEMG